MLYPLSYGGKSDYLLGFLTPVLGGCNLTTPITTPVPSNGGFTHEDESQYAISAMGAGKVKT